jgi:hypothetical protein
MADWIWLIGSLSPTIILFGLFIVWCIKSSKFGGGKTK